MLSEKDLATLTNTLQVPLVTQDILDGREVLTPESEYGLHEILSNYQPDSALLCIALSARKIAARYQGEYANMGVLKIECDRMIHDYAELWVEHAKEQPVDDNLVFDTLAQIPEDLEDLGELLEICSTFLRNVDEETARLCEILAIQARAQVLIADTFIDMMERDEEPEELAANAPLQAYNDNVIPFPGAHVNA